MSDDKYKIDIKKSELPYDNKNHESKCYYIDSNVKHQIDIVARFKLNMYNTINFNMYETILLLNNYNRWSTTGQKVSYPKSYNIYKKFRTNPNEEMYKSNTNFNIKYIEYDIFVGLNGNIIADKDFVKWTNDMTNCTVKDNNLSEDLYKKKLNIDLYINNLYDIKCHIKNQRYVIKILRFFKIYIDNNKINIEEYKSFIDKTKDLDNFKNSIIGCIGVISGVDNIIVTIPDILYFIWDNTIEMTNEDRLRLSLEYMRKDRPINTNYIKNKHTSNLKLIQYEFNKEKQEKQQKMMNLLEARKKARKEIEEEKVKELEKLEAQELQKRMIPIQLKKIETQLKIISNQKLKEEEENKNLINIYNEFKEEEDKYIKKEKDLEKNLKIKENELVLLESEKVELEKKYNTSKGFEKLFIGKQLKTKTEKIKNKTLEKNNINNNISELNTILTRIATDIAKIGENIKKDAEKESKESRPIQIMSPRKSVLKRSKILKQKEEKDKQQERSEERKKLRLKKIEAIEAIKAAKEARIEKAKKTAKAAKATKRGGKHITRKHNKHKTKRNKRHIYKTRLNKTRRHTQCNTRRKTRVVF